MKFRIYVLQTKALIGSVRVGSSYEKLPLNPNSNWTDWTVSHFFGSTRVLGLKSDKKGLNLVTNSKNNRENLGEIAKMLTLPWRVNLESVRVGSGQDVNSLNRVTRTEMRALHCNKTMATEHPRVKARGREGGGKLRRHVRSNTEKNFSCDAAQLFKQRRGTL